MAKSNDFISKLLLSASTNIMSKNLYGKMNDKLKQKSDVKKKET